MPKLNKTVIFEGQIRQAGEEAKLSKEDQDSFRERGLLEDEPKKAATKPDPAPNPTGGGTTPPAT